MTQIYICPTPIGNLEDITLRTLKTLKKVDIILCEDTRVSSVLLNHYNIKKKLVSYHKFNSKSREAEILDYISDNKTIAYISDAGMPGISDPGQELISLAIMNNIKFTVLPGPSASIVALLLSGLNTDRFVFLGFLKEKTTQRKEELNKYKDYGETLIIYESPHRIKSTLEDIFDVMGNREISISREISKYYEETVRGNVEDILEDFENLTLKGEFIIVIGPAEEEEISIDIKTELERLIEEGNSKSKSVKILSKKYGLNKNDVYKISLELWWKK